MTKKRQFVILYHDRKTPTLKTRVYTKDGIVVTFDSIKDAEAQAKKLASSHTNITILYADDMTPYKGKAEKKPKHRGTTRTVTPEKKVSREKVASLAYSILLGLRKGRK